MEDLIQLYSYVFLMFIVLYICDWYFICCVNNANFQTPVTFQFLQHSYNSLLSLRMYTSEHKIAAYIYNTHSYMYIPFLLIKQQIRMIKRSKSTIITPIIAPIIMQTPLSPNNEIHSQLLHIAYSQPLEICKFVIASKVLIALYMLLIHYLSCSFALHIKYY